MTSPADTPTIAVTLTSSIKSLAAIPGFSPAEARVDVMVLLAFTLRVKRAHLIAHPERLLTPAESTNFLELLHRRLNGEPIAYILGQKEFFGHTFHVAPAVLIPRPETELLVELALQHLPANQPARVLDLGTGSGAIAISLALQRPKIVVLAVDQSPAALAIARDNAHRLGAENIEFRESNWFSSVDGQFDLILSNPPYIVDTDPHLARGDVRFEPMSALKGGESGFDCIQSIITQAAAHLRSGGWLIFEHGYNQAETCRQMLQQVGFSAVGSSNDLAGIARASFGQTPA